MSYIVLLLISVGVTIYALVDCWRSTDDEVRGLPRPAWILLIILVGPLGVPAFGATAYLLFGRAPAGSRPRSVVAPDDDPEFLHSLDAARRRAAAEERRRDQRERKDRERQEKLHRKEQRKNDANGAGSGSGPEAAEGDGQAGRPTA
jgi:Phospholipase_D-nuclease N-terminal